MIIQITFMIMIEGTIFKERIIKPEIENSKK
jgi:hypothetical protein